MENNTEQKKSPTYYVGIGASAGGLEALEDFFINAPKNNGMAFIVVQHLSPDYKSMMVELLARKTKMKVVQITDGMFPEADCIHLIPPQKNLTIFHSQLVLTEQIRGSSLNLPIDIFFRSLALDQRKRAVGIILSGTGSDGSLGIKAIKEQGGLIMAQDYSSAKFDGMPKSAIATGLVDYILDTNVMCETLVKHINHPKISLSENNDDENTEETSYVKILSLIRSNTDIDFSYYKPKTILRRIERRISINQLENFEEYIKLLLHSKEECETLSREFLIGVTQFFRDNEAFKIIEEKVIPQLFKNAELNQPLRIWSVGSSTGEEAYSLAILCSEYMSANNIKADLKIFATDLGKEAIKIGGLGIYPQNIVADVPKHLITKYFNNRQDNYQIKESIRQMVVFANHNITSDPPFSKISLVVCRNLLIYFNNQMQQKVQTMFQYSLSQGGFMFLGSSESIIGTSDAFEVISSKWKIFKYKEGYETTAISNLITPQTKIRNVVSDLAGTIKPLIQKSNPLVDLYEKALNYFAPAGVIIDENNTIIHLLKDVRRFLNLQEGKATLNILELADTQLTMVFSNMLFKARKEKKEITLSKFKFKENDKTLYLNISAKLIAPKRKSPEFVLLSIVESRSIEKSQEGNMDVEFDFDEQAAERIRDLERELQYRDENLQTTIEELETSNEELQATNEEMVSSNEELQSTNEELQSVNEELYTVNSQYQEKISELTELNNDVNNLLTNTNIGTIFLDGQLIVRKFTSEIKKTINVMDVDIGRPFSHITYNSKFNKLHDIVVRVMETLIKEEVEVLANDGKWYLMKILPYRHIDNSIHGVLITQINIDVLQKTRLTNLKLYEAIEQSTVGTLITDLQGNIEYINEKYSQISGYSSSELIGKNPRIFKSGVHDSFFYQNLWKTIKSGKVWKGKIHNTHKKGHLFWERAIISPVKNQRGEIINFLAIKEDITEQVKNEKRLEYKKAVIENTEAIADIGSWVYDVEENTLSWSNNTYKIFGLNKNSFTPTFDNFLATIHPEDKDFVVSAYNDAIDNNKQYRIQHRIIRPNGEIRYIEEISKEIKTNNNKVIRSIGVVKDITDFIDTTKNLELEHAKALKAQEELQLKTNAFEQMNSQFSILIDTLPNAFAYHEIILDNAGTPIDFKFININEAFSSITGFDKDTVIGNTAKQIIPDIEQVWIDNYGKVALLGKSFDFEQYSKPLDKTFSVHAYSPLKGFFAVIFKEKN